MLALLLALVVQAAPASLLVRPLELSEAVPDTRAVALVRVRVEDPAAAETSEPLARRLFGQLGPAGLLEAANAYSQRPTRDVRGLTGTFTRAMLDPRIAESVFEGAGTLAGPLTAADGGVYYAMSISREAACRQIFIAGTDAGARARAEAVLRELKAGADFAAVARERSDDKASALRGGDLAIYERGPRDALLRAAAFGAKVGEIVGPLESPQGFHVLQRVGVEALDARLRDDSWARVRAILVAFGGAAGAEPALEREHEEAERIANDLALRIRDGEDMAALAARFDDDRGGRARSGDLGWVRRGTSEIPQFFDKLFVEPPGTLLGPIATRSGFVLFRRENPGPRTVVVPTKNSFVALFEWLRWSCEEPARAVEAPGFDAARAALLALQAEPGPARFTRFGELGLPLARSAEGLLARWQRLRGEECFPGLRTTQVEERVQSLSRALAELEPWFAERAWPERERAIDAALGALRERWAPLAPVAVDLLLDELGIDDPRLVLEAPLVDRWPSTQAVPDGLRARGDSLLRVPSSASVAELLHATLHALVHHIRCWADFEHGGTFDAPERDWVALHALFEAASGSVTERVFDVQLDGRSRPCDVGGSTPEQRAAVRAIWKDKLEGRCDLATACRRVAELFRAK